ncbi:MAG TPA: hypothetical protein VMT17_15675 [Anaeromyxobacteraceae bacterium]|nr:hypothetical protein [Anaeromyxobacteraceae bacterium]
MAASAGRSRSPVPERSVRDEQLARALEALARGEPPAELGAREGDDARPRFAP